MLKTFILDTFAGENAIKPMDFYLFEFFVFALKDSHSKLHLSNDFDEKRNGFSMGGWGSFEASNLVINWHHEGI